MMKHGSDFVRHVLTLATGTAVAQAIIISATPILTRIYSPEEFGIFVVFGSLVSILGVFSTGRYEYAILAANNDDDAWHCVFLVSVFSSIAAILVFVAGSLTVYFFYDYFNQKYSIAIIFLASMTMFVNGIYRALYYWSNRFKRYKRLSSNRMLGSLSVALISILLGYFGFKKYGLIIGALAGQTVNTTLLFVQITGENKQRGVPSWENLKSQFFRYIDYPKYLIASGFLNSFSSQAHILFISAFFGTVISGAIGLYQRVVRVPVSILGNAISDVFKQQASFELTQNHQCKTLFLKTGLRLFMIGLFPFIILLFFAPVLFPFVFGSEWQISGEYAQILSWMFIAGFVVSPLSSLFYIGEKQKYDLIMQIILITLVGVAMYGGYFFSDPKLTIIFFTIAYCIKYILEFTISYYIAAGKI